MWITVPPSSQCSLSCVAQVLCDLGTDCADCGPWRFNATGDGSSFQADMPIKRLLSKNVRHAPSILSDTDP